MRKIYVRCLTCGRIELGDENYRSQLWKENDAWYCPRCGKQAMWEGIYHPCFVPGCTGLASEDDDICNVCGTNQYYYFMEHEDEIVGD